MQQKSDSRGKGKIRFTAENVNFAYGTQPLWKQKLTIQIKNGERIALKGKNGAGNTTLLKLILGKVELQARTVFRGDNKSVYIDQDYAPIDNKLSVYEQANIECSIQL
nr:ATP-binding cassette domain-containing protein [Lunatimonas salinarum]